MENRDKISRKEVLRILKRFLDKKYLKKFFKVPYSGTTSVLNLYHKIVKSFISHSSLQFSTGKAERRLATGQTVLKTGG